MFDPRCVSNIIHDRPVIYVAIGLCIWVRNLSGARVVNANEAATT